MDFSVYEHHDHTSSEESGESSRARNYNTLDNIKTLRIRDRASPVPFKANHAHTSILKSKSGHSIKDFEKRQEL
jgi:hypothetical protein